MSRTATRLPAGPFKRTELGLIISLLFSPLAAWAAPHGGAVTSGSAIIEQAGSVTNINQSTQKAAINWQGFGIQAGETVNFNQPNASAVTLNRVIGNERSVINGALNANGQVFLINSAGVLFGKGSSVNVGGLVASTRDISDADFNAGNFVFKGDGNGSVINLGTITAKDGGYVALLGNSVSNQGVIAATKGTVAMSAGNRITLNFNGDSLLNVTLDEGTLDALVENKQAVLADGGTVLLTAKAADELLGAQVNNSGIIRARSIDDLTGKIELYAHGGTAHVDGTLDASAPDGGDGGFVETSGDIVKVADSASVTTRSAQGKTGTWLIDPNDFTVAASGGDMSGAAVAQALADNNFTIATATMGTAGGHGDIHVNDAITWDSDTRLTLDAERDIHINNAITANGAAAGLTLNTGGDYHIRTKASYAGAELDANGKPVAKQDTSGGVYGSVTFNNGANLNGLTINGNSYTLIHDMAGIAALNNQHGNFALAKSLDAAGTTYTSAVAANLGSDSRNTILTGLGNTISNLTITAPGAEGIGLIGFTKGTAVLRDIGLVDANVSGETYVGALLGRSENATIATVHNAYSTGNVSGNLAGGLVGIANNIEYAYSTADVSGAYAGGLAAMATAVTHAHATGDVNTPGGSGGLLSSFRGTSIDYVYATGNVISTDSDATQQGGLIGSVSPDTPSLSIKNSFATGNVSGRTQVGGLLGIITFNGSQAGHRVAVENTYATGNVTSISTRAPADNGAGGLIGAIVMGSWNPSSPLPHVTIANSHATGKITLKIGGSSGAHAGGLIGFMNGSITGDPCCGRLASITDSYATGEVDASGSTAPVSLGGLVGRTEQVNITNSYATGNVRGGTNALGNLGGLVGVLLNANVSNTYGRSEQVP